MFFSKIFKFSHPEFSFKVCQGDRNKFCEEIINSSAPSYDFYIMAVLSTLIVSLGLVANNVVLLIGGMLVAPLLSPIMAISLGVIIGNFKVIFRSIRIFVIALILASFVSFLVANIVEFDIHDITLLNSMEVSFFTFLVAIVAGLAASYAWIKPNLSNALPGTAIAVTLIPPLCTTGLALASGEWLILKVAFLVLLLNIAGIIFASSLIFFVMDFYKSKRKILAEVKEEEDVQKEGGILNNLVK